MTPARIRGVRRPLTVDDATAEPFGPDPASVMVLPNDLDVDGWDDGGQYEYGIEPAYNFGAVDPTEFNIGVPEVWGPSRARVPLEYFGTDSRGQGLPRDSDEGGIPGEVGTTPYTLGVVVALEDFELTGHSVYIRRPLEGNMGPVTGEPMTGDYNSQIAGAYRQGLIPQASLTDIYGSLAMGV